MPTTFLTKSDAKKVKHGGRGSADERARAEPAAEEPEGAGYGGGVGTGTQLQAHTGVNSGDGNRKDG
jgi:hypothetical protein